MVYWVCILSNYDNSHFGNLLKIYDTNCNNIRKKHTLFLSLYLYSGKSLVAASPSVSPSTVSSASSSNPSTRDLTQPVLKPPNTTSAPPFTTTSTTSVPATASATNSSMSTVVKKQRPLLPKETAQSGQASVVWSQTGNKIQTSSPKWHLQKVQKQPHGSQSQSSVASSNTSTRYQTRQSVKGNWIFHFHLRQKKS